MEKNSFHNRANMAVELLSTTNGVNKKDSNYGYPGKPITEIITNGFFTVDRKWKITYWNKAAEKLLGVQEKDIMGKNVWEKFAGIIPLDFYAVYHKAFLQDVPVHFQEYWGEKGAWFDVFTYHCDDTLSVSFKTSKQSEQPRQHLSVLNELYRFVTEVTNDCLWEWDLRAKEIFWIDGGHKRVFGYQVENALIPQNFWESRLHPEDKVRILTRLNKIISEGSVSVWEDEYRFQRANGDYAYVHDRGHIIYDDDKKASRMIGATQDITENVLLQNKLTDERQTRQREITDAVLTAQENERAYIGEEMHDNLNQILAVAKMYIQMAKVNETDREINLDKSLDLIVNAIAEIRKIAKALIIPDKHVNGLYGNIKILLDDLIVVNPIKIEFHKNGIKEDDLTEKMQLNIFRIIQEQLNNIFKHANATQADINLSKHKNEVILLISDNGKGCDTSKKNEGVGIKNIISRAGLFNGSADIESKPGKGFQLKVVMQCPLPQNIDDYDG